MWQQEALDALTKSGQKAWKENKEMFDAAQVFVHSNEELKEAFKKAAVA